MHRRYNFIHFLLASFIVLVLTPLIEAVDAQAQIVFISQRDGHFRDDIPGIPKLPAAEIYVMDADGGNLRRLTNDPGSDSMHPHGLPMVNGLSSCLIGMGTFTLNAVRPLLKST